MCTHSLFLISPQCPWICQTQEYVLHKCRLFINLGSWVLQGRGKYHSEQLNLFLYICWHILGSNSLISMLILTFSITLAFLLDWEDRSKIGVETFCFLSFRISHAIHPNQWNNVILHHLAPNTTLKSLSGCHEQYLQDNSFHYFAFFLWLVKNGCKFFISLTKMWDFFLKPLETGLDLWLLGSYGSPGWR